MRIELSGFQTQARAVQVSVSETVTADFELGVAKVSENVTVTAETPLVDTTSSAVGGVVDARRVENLPLNGRQFANLAVTIPGVGLGFHADPTKSTQYSPQINGGNGRNVNYRIDGGDNNDDTVGGLLQFFPLEAIQEFNFLTSRYKAEYGRSNGGVMNIVTKSGTNDYRGSAFELFRDQSMNAQTETERRGEAGQAGVSPQPVRRQFRRAGGAGPRAFLRGGGTHQPGHDPGSHDQGTLPVEGRHLRNAVSRDAVHRQGTVNLTPTQYLTVRYGRNDNSQPYGATPNATSDSVAKALFSLRRVEGQWRIADATRMSS